MTIEDKSAEISEFLDGLLTRAASARVANDTTNSSGNCQTCKQPIPQERWEALKIKGTDVSCCRCVKCQSEVEKSRYSRPIFSSYGKNDEEPEE